MRRVIVLSTTLLIALAIAGVQGAAAQSIDPGMTKSQVIERLGAPAAERSSGAYTYLFYQNGRERTAGMSDLVILQNDAVVDAIFRSAAREYTGSSSSPEGKMPANSAPTGERLALPVATQAPAQSAPAPASPPPPDTTRSP
jgi:outer membrane protein assembly factor BamE (lipoprotein component of BamABCDE complex)